MGKRYHASNAWAVRLRGSELSPEYEGRLAGRYYFEWPKPSHEGCPVALFETRREAREAIDSKPEYLYRTPVRVRVRVETIDG